MELVEAARRKRKKKQARYCTALTEALLQLVELVVELAEAAGRKKKNRLVTAPLLLRLYYSSLSSSWSLWKLHIAQGTKRKKKVRYWSALTEALLRLD